MSATAAPNRFLKLSKWGIKVTSALLIALLLTEVTMRVLGLGLPSRGPNNALPLRQSVSEERAPGLALELIPGAKGTVVYPGHGDVPARNVDYAINPEGFRDIRFRTDRKPGSFRIMVIGDSITYGTGVDQADTLPRQMQALLQEQFGVGLVDVMNCAVYAYNMRQSMALLKLRHAEFQPDLVLFVATINDASGIGIESETKEQAWETRLTKALGLTSGVWDADEQREASPAIRRMGFLRRHSVLVDEVAYTAFNSLLGRIKDKGYRADWAVGSAGHASVSAALDVGLSEAKKAGFELRVVMFPSLNGEVDEGFTGQQETDILEDLCIEKGIPFLDVLPAMAGRSVKGLRAHPHDRHPNGFALGLAARFLNAALVPDDLEGLSEQAAKFVAKDLYAMERVQAGS